MLLVGVLLVAGCGWTAGAEVDAALESVLRGVRVRAVTDGGRTVPLRDLRRVAPLWPAPTAGTLDCTGGWAADLSTLVRTAPARVYVRDGRLVLAAGLGLTSLQFGYTACKVGVRPLFGLETGGFSVEVKNGSMTAEVSLGASCTPRLETLETLADEVEVRVGGQGLGDLLEDKLLSLVLDHFRPQFLQQVGRELAGLVSDHLRQLHFC